MIQHSKALIALLLVATQILFGCQTEDPGPLQESNKEFAVVDFDRLEMGNAFIIQVSEASTFSIKADGDSRNLNDLMVYKSGSTLIIKFDKNINRNHETHISITMPALKGVNFSAASASTITGFESTENLDLILSGASICQLVAGYCQVNSNLSGASNLVMRGLGDEFTADVSGASIVSAFEYPVGKASLSFSGASYGKVTVSDQLEITATGASSILYRGSPSIHSEISGASTVQKD